MWSGELPLDLERNCLRESPRRLLEDPSGGIFFLEPRKINRDIRDIIYVSGNHQRDNHDKLIT